MSAFLRRSVYEKGIIIMKMHFDNDYLKENMMGPNAIRLLEELLGRMTLKPGMRVLDLGCGRGLTSAYLASLCNAQVFAVDLWIPASENYERFKQLSLCDSIIPLHADANDLPFADGYFDAVISVDSYHYFGMDEGYMARKLAPLVKKGGVIAFCVPGLKYDVHKALPPEMLLSWRPEDIDTLQTCEWWRALLDKSENIDVLSVGEMRCFDACWEDWLKCDNPYAVSDRPAMNAGAGKYMNFVSALCRRI